MVEVVLPCVVQGCSSGPEGAVWKTAKLPLEVAEVQMRFHRESDHPAQVQGTAQTSRGQPAAGVEKLKSPTLHLKNCWTDEEGWAFFLHKWKEFKTAGGTSVTTNLKQHLASSLGQEVEEAIYSTIGPAAWEDASEEDILKHAKKTCVRGKTTWSTG